MRLQVRLTQVLEDKLAALINDGYASSKNEAIRRAIDEAYNARFLQQKAARPERKLGRPFGG